MAKIFIGKSGLLTVVWLQLALLALTTAPAVSAGRDVVGYELEGVRFSPEERTRLNAADERLRRGVAALESGDWTTASSECAFALGTFENVGLPDRGKVAPTYLAARICVADSNAAIGNWVRACHFYRITGYQTMRIRDPKAECQKLEAKREASIVSHEDFQAVSIELADQMNLVIAAPEGPQKQARAAEMAGICNRMASLAHGIPTATAKAGYCRGVIAFVDGKGGHACEIMFTSAQNLRSVLSEPMLDEQRRDGEDLARVLATYRPICNNMGYVWPDLSDEWPWE